MRRAWLWCALACVVGCEGKPADPLADLRGGKLVGRWDFDDGKLDPAAWNDTAPPGGWAVKDGQVFSAGTRNQALWLKQPLPTKVRVEFDVRSESPDGDIKVEVFGDGAQHQSGYVLIFGGWRNKINTIARLDEHGKDRKEGAVGVKVEQGKTYKMAVVRTDQKVRWYLDRDPGTLLLEYDDPAPLYGAGHDRFAFNDWAVPLWFDNVAVYDLAER